MGHLTKIVGLLLISTLGFAQYPQRSSTLTITEKIVHERTKSAHGFSVGNWLTIDNSGEFVKGSDPTSQEFMGIVSAVTTNTFDFVKPGGTVNTLSGLTAGQRYFAQTDGTIGTTATDMPVGIAVSTTTLEMLMGTFGTTLPPPSNQATLLTFSDIASTTVTASWTRGNTDGSVILLMSENPISTFPSNNVPYTDGANFGDGDDLGGGVFVMYVGTASTVAITGLTAGTTYYGVVFEFVTQGFFTTYNTTVGSNGDNFTTLQDATTPTSQWVTTLKTPKENSIRIQGVRGNGDGIIVVVNDSIPVSIDPVDGTPYPANGYGLGSSLGERNYVTNLETGTDFEIPGLTRDKKYYWKIYEYESTGYLYNTIAESDSSFTAWAYDGGTGAFAEGTTSAGESYLTSTAYIWYDFSDLTFADEAAITNGDAGLVDQGPQSNTATIVNSPTTNEITFHSGTRKGVRSSTTNMLNTGTTGNSIFNGNFEIHWAGRIEDGQPPSTTYLAGFADGTSSRVGVSILTNGKPQLTYRATSGGGQTQLTATTGALLSNGANDNVYIRAVFNFTTDVITCYINGVEATGWSVSGTAISAQDPSTFSSTKNLYVGGNNDNGTPASQGAESTIVRFAVTPLLTTQQATDVKDFIEYQTSSTAFQRFTKTVTTGDFVNANDSLQTSGTPGNWGDYIMFDDIIPDSLQEFIGRVPFRINGALSTSTYGISILMKHDLSTEANRAVDAGFVTDTDIGSSFGRVSLYSGNGTVSASAFTFRSISSGAFVPAEDSVYTLYLERDIQVNDAAYFVKIVDSYDSTILTTQFTSVNSPEYAYFGTTMQIGIRLNGGSFKIGEFSVIRTAEAQQDTSPPPAPGTFDVYVDKSGSDANPDCSEALPCLTVQRGFEEILEASPTVEDMKIGAGTFTETGGTLIVPANLGDCVGAGKDVTIITASNNLYNAPSLTFSSSGYLFNMTSSSSTSVTTHIKDMTLSGANRNIRGGVYLRFRDGAKFTNVKFNRFNTVGMWILRVDGLEMQGCDWVESAFGNTGGNHGQINIAWASNVLVNNFTLTAQTFGTGEGIVGIGDTQTGRHLTDVTFSNGVIDLSRDSPYTPNGHCFAWELLDMVFDNLLFENIYSRNNCSQRQNGTTIGNYRITGCEFDLQNRSLCVEGQVSNIEFDHNYVHGLTGGMVHIYNPVGNPPQPSNFENWNIHHNVVELLQSGFNQGVVGSTNWPLDNVTIANNTVIYTTTSGSQQPLFYYTSTGGTLSNLLIEDNAIQGQAPVNQNMLSVGGSGLAAGAIARNNKATHVNTLQTVTNLTGGAGQNNATGLSGFFVSSGVKPFPYYSITVSSPLYNAGNGGDSVGAYQP